MALNHTNIKQNIHVLIPNIIAGHRPVILLIISVAKFNSPAPVSAGQVVAKISGILYPPKNKIALILLNSTIELYSAKKKNTNGTLECSVKKPATSSDSASFKSNGVRDVSAKTEIK